MTKYKLRGNKRRSSKAYKQDLKYHNKSQKHERTKKKKRSYKGSSKTVKFKTKDGKTVCFKVKRK